MKPVVCDAFALIGLSLLCFGIGAYSWPLAPIVAGASFLGVGILGARRGPPPTGGPP